MLQLVGLGNRDWGLGVWVSGSGVWVQRLGSRVMGWGDCPRWSNPLSSEFGINKPAQGLGLRVEGSGFRVEG